MKSWSNYKETYRSEADIFDCVRAGDFKALVTLLSQQVDLDIDAKNHRGYSPLMLAVYHGEADCAEALLRCGADVNSTDAMNNTVLMAAAFKGKLEILQLLIQFGADTGRKNKSNMDTRDWALMFGREQALAYLNGLSPQVDQGSKVKSLLRFINLSLMMLKSRFKPG
ncbi:ankyrin repeat domain-containing protein [Reinekea marinisedimentorum]|uniref:Uncharacterized protein n=1 Tax=Reinekea marinisedimentorum TaxID=230495 RepID=A0A4R3IBP8_9GAMM|nr:ankyrin repeat domain-containing protein [Reinekea marinisedimentorum]TCS42701.1 hypothetical protein BCF53_103371 [Reinekea marinisedimentorum]